MITQLGKMVGRGSLPASGDSLPSRDPAIGGQNENCSFVRNRGRVLSILLMALTAVTYADTAEQTAYVGPTIEFAEEQMDVGRIRVGDLEPFEEEIVFFNRGDQPLILSNVSACCGTRVTAWPQEPIAPGGQGAIAVSFSVRPNPRPIRRSVTITANTPESRHVYRIVGQVLPDPAPATADEGQVARTEPRRAAPRRRSVESPPRRVPPASLGTVEGDQTGRGEESIPQPRPSSSVAEETIGPILEFTEEKRELGAIAIEDVKPFEEEIVIVNRGDYPLSLFRVTACRGTRVVDWPRSPIPPGEEGSIYIEFRQPPLPRPISRTITIVSNASSSPHEIRIVGNVVSSEKTLE